LESTSHTVFFGSNQTVQDAKLTNDENKTQVPMDSRLEITVAHTTPTITSVTDCLRCNEFNDENEKTVRVTERRTSASLGLIKSEIFVADGVISLGRNVRGRLCRLRSTMARSAGTSDQPRSGQAEVYCSA
jgi:hypothetical protein